MTDKLIQMGLLKYGCSLKQDFLSLDRARMKLYKKIIEIQAKWKKNLHELISFLSFLITFFQTFVLFTNVTELLTF